jgi:hypothetical protein
MTGDFPCCRTPVTRTCNSCKHTAPAAGFIRELTPSWVPTGNHVCRDPDACYERRRDREIPTRGRAR